MANHTLNENYNGKTPLRKFWPIVKSNFANLLSWFNAHIAGTADRHKADDIDYSSSQTVKQKIDDEATLRKLQIRGVTDNLNAEMGYRQEADSALRSDLNAEIINRQNADKEVKKQIPIIARSDWDSTDDLRTKLTIFDDGWEGWDNHDEYGMNPPEKPIAIYTKENENGNYWEHYLFSVSGKLYRQSVSPVTGGDVGGSTGNLGYMTSGWSRIFGETGNLSSLSTDSKADLVSAINELLSKINSETSARSGADNALGTRITSEETARQNADNALQAAISLETNNRNRDVTEILDSISEINAALAESFSGSYNDLADKPALKTIATSGSYDDLTDKPTSMTPTSHASTGTTYGIGTASNYGHVKTSDSVTSTSSTSSGIAATPKAVKTAYDKAVEVDDKKIWNSSGVTIGGTDSMAFSSQNVNIKGNRSVAIAYGNSYDTVTEIDGDTSLLAACAASKIKGSTSAIIGGYSHVIDGIRAVILGGYNNIAHAYNVVVGKMNKEPTATDYNSNSGDLFVIGNGTASTRSNALRVTAGGDVYTAKAINGTGADYAELREWVDGNPENQDRCGLMVTLAGSKIRLAQPGDNLSRVGVISGNPCVIGNNYADAWHGKYKKDVFGRYETVPVHNDAEYEEVIVKDDEGNETTVTKLVKEEYDGYAYVLSDDYDLSLEADYISREERPEFDFMGTHGEIVTIDDGTCGADGYCVPGENGIATKGDNGFYVMERIDENHIRVFVR